jgi:hypothetical protein
VRGVAAVAERGLLVWVWVWVGSWQLQWRGWRMGRRWRGSMQRSLIWLHIRPSCRRGEGEGGYPMGEEMVCLCWKEIHITFMHANGLAACLYMPLIM